MEGAAGENEGWELGWEKPGAPRENRAGILRTPGGLGGVEDMLRDILMEGVDTVEIGKDVFLLPTGGEGGYWSLGLEARRT